jgi:malonyl-CoA O-methyltransferase
MSWTRVLRPALMMAPQIDFGAARQAFERAAATYGEAAVMAREVERRMAERLQYVRLDPRRVLDAGCGPGEGLKLLRSHYSNAQLIGVDLAWAMTRAARDGRPMLDRVKSFFSGAACHLVCADISRLPLASASLGMVWSNLALAWARDPVAVLSEFARVIEPQGLLMFSSYGPDTLKELRGAFAQVDGYSHVHRFVDMHDLGDMLVAAGFAEPVMDMEIVTLAYADVDALVRDLRRSGQSNVDAGRRRGLMPPAMWAKMAAAYEIMRREGRLPATFEIVYGHAWKAERRMRSAKEQVVKTNFISRKAK